VSSLKKMTSNLVVIKARSITQRSLKFYVGASLRGRPSFKG
jgi:hypothetical protein